AGVVNAATLMPNLAPGAYAALQCVSLANCRASAIVPPIPDSLCEASVKFNSLQAKVTYASPELIMVLTPRSLPPQTDVEVAVSREGASEPAVVAIAAANFSEAAPAIFPYRLDDGVDRAVMQSAAGTANGPGLTGSDAGPARLGEAQILYANALGPTDQTVADGDP